MTPDRFRAVTDRYTSLRVAVLGDFCLDRYLEIDPDRAETSIETGLPVHNVVRVRSQPGAAGTILNNLVALGIGTLHPIGFCGTDGEGYELQAALRALRGVVLDDLLVTPDRRTFTYCKPLMLRPGAAPVELNRLDSKNWTPTPLTVEAALIASLHRLAPSLDALILLDQVDRPDTGVVTARVREAVGAAARARPELWILADSRRGLHDFPPVVFKMNAAELASLTRQDPTSNPVAVRPRAVELARHNGRPVFVTLAENGIVSALPDGTAVHSHALPLRGQIDIVGAGDAVTANLAAALAAGADVAEAADLANAAASIVIHQLGTTGTASVDQLAQRLP
ncbi:MAG TPA: PfkB family carbohydrate kinase [Verrucomicrobiota bacterium]|nr:PfkB family carbohydrate kinase [Verrucomicrobiota bacterium]HNU52463.1 PfkB family carbohydrate kinase [Verrucomicrobiota bacterium]